MLRLAIHKGEWSKKVRESTPPYEQPIQAGVKHINNNTHAGHHALDFDYCLSKIDKFLDRLWVLRLAVLK
ncbi:Uncharacterized protein TCM_013702 [Theobroma cacao]|uniref:Uncharacterized protein n=1 Tax=Theobroma cacao TaxID=3641 RepID=A0A061FWQ0_THECC|nr:Uncharacterized protein TCM_013702 [Theobroma cacao]